MTLALYYKPTYEKLKSRIDAAAPALEVALYDEEGRIQHRGREVDIGAISPEFFWIHGELFKSPRLMDYFRLMQDSGSIRWLHTINTGLDQLPYLPLVEKGVAVTNNHGQAIAIAEYVFARVLAQFQDIAGCRQRQQEKVWRQRGFREICGTQWLIVGFGHIGQAIAQRAKAFGAEVTAVRRSKDGAGLADRVLSPEAIGEALPQADVVVLACASNAQTRGLVDRNFLAQMQEASVLVNIARGDLVNEEDLHQALDAGRPEHAILDVFMEEPLPPESWFWDHPRVTLTPHTSNAGSGMPARSVETFLENLSRIMEGRPLINQVRSEDIV